MRNPVRMFDPLSRQDLFEKAAVALAVSSCAALVVFADPKADVFPPAVSSVRDPTCVARSRLAPSTCQVSRK